MSLQNSSLSIIIPTRNRPQHLNRCLTALLACMKRGDQIIICDNSNSSETLQYHRSIQNKHKNIFYCSVKKPGSSAARNAGLSLAKNRYLAFIDDDCIVDGNWREMIANVANKERRSGEYAIHQGEIIYSFDNRKLSTYLFQIKQQVTRSLLKLDEVKNKSIIIVTYINAGNFFLHASLLKKLRYLFDADEFPYVGEERDLAIRAQLIGIPVILEPKVKVTHLNSKSTFITRLKRSFLQGVVTGKIMKRYAVDKKTARLFGLTQNDGFFEVFDQTLSAIPKHFSNQCVSSLAQGIVRMHKLLYLLGKQSTLKI